MAKQDKKRILLYELSRNPNVTFVCQKIGISRNTYYRWIKEDDFHKDLVRQAIINGENYINDVAENKLIKKITVDEYWPAIRYRLDRKNLKYNSVMFPPTTPSPKVDEGVLLELEDIDNEFNE